MGEGEQDSWTRHKKKIQVVDGTCNVKFFVPHPQDGGSAEGGRRDGGGMVDGWLLQPCSRSFPPNSLVKDWPGAEVRVSLRGWRELALQNPGG